MKNNALKRHYKIIVLMFAILIIRGTLYVNSEIGAVIDDSPSFINYKPEEGIRSPGYPFIIDIFQIVFPNNFKVAVSVFQMLVSFVAVYFFYQISLEICEAFSVSKRRLPHFMTLLFGCCPGVFMVDTYVLAESLAMSATVFFLYFAFMFVRYRKVRDGIWMVLFSLIGMLIKTALFVYTFDALILLVILYIFDIKSRSKILKVSISMTCVLLIYTMWIGYIHKETGVMNFSSLPPRHTLAKVLQSGVYKNYKDASIVSSIDSILYGKDDKQGYDSTTPVMELLAGENATIKERNIVTAQFNRDCIACDKPRYYKWLLSVIVLQTSNASVVEFAKITPRTDYWSRLITVFFFGNYIKISIIHLLNFVLLYFGIVRWRKEGKIPYLHLGLWGGISTILISVPIGTYALYPRTLCYVLPFFFLMVNIIIIELTESRLYNEQQEDGGT